MRSFILALALALPLSLTACGNDTAEPGDMEDVIGDGEIIDEPGEMDPDDTMIEDGAPMGDSADVIGDGEIFDEPGEPDADALGQ